MGPSDDYQDEMDRLSSQDADQVLAGRGSGSGAARAAEAAADRLKRGLLVPPAPEVMGRHLAAMRAAAVTRPDVQVGSSILMNTRKRFATLGLAATLVLGAGIAAALTLPDTAAEQAKERTADLDVPKGLGNQGQSEIASEHGKAVSEIARDDSTEGCEHGRAVSAAASAKSQGNKPGDAGNPDPCAKNGNGAAASAGNGSNGNHGQGSNAGGNGKSQSSHAGGVGSASDRAQGQGGPPDTRGASAGHAKNG